MKRTASQISEDRIHYNSVLAAIIKNSDDGIISKDLDGIIQSWNKGAEKIFGYSAEEIIGKSVTLLIPKDRMKEEKYILNKIRKGKRVNPFETVRVRKDGTLIDLSVSVSPVCDTSGKIIGASKIFRSITKEKREREKLQQAEKFLRRDAQILSQISDGVGVTDLETNVIYWNPAFARILGWKAQEILGMPISTIFPPEAKERVGEIRLLLASGREFNEEMEFQHKDGSRIWVQVHAGRYLDEKGKPAGYVGVVRNIQRRVQAENRLRTTHERMKLAAQAAAAGIWELDIATQKMEMDAQMYALYGVPPGAEKRIGEDRWKVIHPEDRKRIVSGLRIAVLRKRRHFDEEYRIFRENDGALRYIRSTGSILADERGNPQRIIGLNRDVTEERLHAKQLADALAAQKELTFKAKEGERAKSEFLSVMGHELRTPLNGILGFSDLLSQDSSLHKEAQEYVKIIRQSGELLLHVLNEILDYVNIESGRLEIIRLPFSPKKMLEDVVRAIGPNATEKGLELKTEMDDSMPAMIVGDGTRIQQILLSLANNAIKYTEKGRVQIYLGHRLENNIDRWLELRIEDTGEGIEKEKMEAIFEPFVQGDSSLSRRHGGAGMGLVVSRRLVDLMQGKMEVHSKRGIGSKFVIEIPLGDVAKLDEKVR